MHHHFEDIIDRAGYPDWWDQNGTPRYGKFNPEMCPNIYSHTVVLLEIQCQSCGEKFYVEMHNSLWEDRELPPKQWHYGDPPAHGCAGDTMNCEDCQVVEVWRKTAGKWKRLKKLEGKIE